METHGKATRTGPGGMFPEINMQDAEIGVFRGKSLL